MPDLMKKKNWTVAYRFPNTLRADDGPDPVCFIRASNWSGTWDESQRATGNWKALHPDADVWNTPTYESDLTEWSAREDIGNIMTDEGIRVPVIDREFSPEMISVLDYF